jgi:hypothetical protein
MKYKLLNFDHGNKHSESFYIGPFKIEINDQHCQNILHLPRNESITFGYNEYFKKAIIENPRISGGWIETAEVEVGEDKLQSSIIYPETSSKNSIDDLCLLLSFITGRIVSFEGNQFLDYYNPDVHTDKTVHYGYFLRKNFCWKKLQAIKNEGISLQFYYLIMAYHANDLVAKAVYCNNILNTAYDKWYKKSSIAFIENNIQSKIKLIINQCLEENNIHKTIKEDILNRVNNICQPSAIYKLKHFLKDINLYPKYDNSEIHKRLKWINDVRNLMAHTGTLPKDKKLPDSLLREVVSSVIYLVLRINQYYFGCKILELDDPYLEHIRGLITNYFYEGKFSGRSIFDESYEEYMERAKKEWLTE